MTPMVKTQVYLPEEELSGLHDLARGTGKSVAELIRQAIRQTWFTTNARGPVALWKGEVRSQSVDHDVIYDDP